MSRLHSPLSAGKVGNHCSSAETPRSRQGRLEIELELSLQAGQVPSRASKSVNLEFAAPLALVDSSIAHSRLGSQANAAHQLATASDSSFSSSVTRSMADPLSAEADWGVDELGVGLSDDADTRQLAPTAPKTVSPLTARRSRTDSNATQRERVASEVTLSSFTPRGHDSPLARRLALSAEPADAERPPLSRQSTVGAGSARRTRGYDRTTRRNLIAGAAADGDLVRLQALLVVPEDVDNGDRPASTFGLANEPHPHSGLAPIHFAAQNGHEDVVKWLVEEAGALPDFEDAEGEVRLLTLPLRTPQSCSWTGRTDFALDGNPFRAQTPLHKAALRGHLDVCRFLLSRQVDINAADSDGWTASLAFLRARSLGCFQS